MATVLNAGSVAIITGAASGIERAPTERFGHIDVLIHSAGVVGPGALESVTDADVVLEVRGNLLGTIPTGAVLPISASTAAGTSCASSDWPR